MTHNILSFAVPGALAGLLSAALTAHVSGSGALAVAALFAVGNLTTVGLAAWIALARPVKDNDLWDS